MGDEISEGGQGVQHDVYDLVQKIEDLTLQVQEVDADISIFRKACDKVLAIQEVRENELKGYVIFSVFPCKINIKMRCRNFLQNTFKRLFASPKYLDL